MNEYNLKVNFEKGQIKTNLKKLVQNDYNTTKLNFTFDKEGRVLFKMSYPDGTQYVDEIENNELVFGKGVLNQEGTYEYEIALYTEDGRLTNHAIGKFEVRSELVNTDELVEVDDRVPVLDNLISEVTAIKTSAENGEFNGEDGVTPTIGENGNWFIGDTDTGLPSQGPEGKPGPAGGVSLEEVTAITGNTEELETESKQLVGAINEVLNNSGGSSDSLINVSISNSFNFDSFSTDEKQSIANAVLTVTENGTKRGSFVINDKDYSHFISVTGGSTSGTEKSYDFTSCGEMITSSTKVLSMQYGTFRIDTATGTCKSISKTRTYINFNNYVDKTYVDTAIANAITTSLEASY